MIMCSYYARASFTCVNEREQTTLMDILSFPNSFYLGIYSLFPPLPIICFMKNILKEIIFYTQFRFFFFLHVLRFELFDVDVLRTGGEGQNARQRETWGARYC